MTAMDILQAGPVKTMHRWAPVMAIISCVLAQGLPQQALAANETGPAPSGVRAAGPAGLAAKRLGPAAVAPVTIGKRRFEVVHWARDRGMGQNGGYIAALDRASGKELWLLRVYETRYDKSLERDVQDVFIKSMSKKFFSTDLKITDENGRSYVVNTQTRAVKAD